MLSRVFGVLSLALLGVVAQGSSCEPEEDLDGMFECDPTSECCSAAKVCEVGKGCVRLGGTGSCTFGAGGGMGMGTCFCGEPMDVGETEFYESYSADHGSPGSLKDAFAMFSAGCKADAGSACLFQGLMLANGDAGTKNYKAAARSVKKSCDLGHATGCFYYGAALDMGFGVEKNRRRAKRYFKKACKGGEPFGCEPEKILKPIRSGTPQYTLNAVAEQMDAAHAPCE